MRNIPAWIWLLLIAAATPMGCARHEQGIADDPATDPKRGDVNGYYEESYQGAVYVLGTMESVQKLRSGQPVTTVRGGYAKQGIPVYFETDSRSLDLRLRAEYERRYRQHR
jgi:hypothetical protein